MRNAAWHISESLASPTGFEPVCIALKPAIHARLRTPLQRSCSGLGRGGVHLSREPITTTRPADGREAAALWNVASFSTAARTSADEVTLYRSNTARVL